MSFKKKSINSSFSSEHTICETSILYSFFYEKVYLKFFCSALFTAAKYSIFLHTKKKLSFWKRFFQSFSNSLLLFFIIHIIIIIIIIIFFFAQLFFFFYHHHTCCVKCSFIFFLNARNLYIFFLLFSKVDTRIKKYNIH